MRSLILPALLTALLLSLPAAAARPFPDVEVGNVVVDLRWMTACVGPWGHEERTTMGPVTVVRYVCDDPGT